MAGGDRNLTVGGDAVGQFVTGDNNDVLSVVVNATHSAVTVVGPAKRPRPVRRERIERLPRRPGRPLLGRDTELASLVRSIADDEPAGVHGPEGIGKSTLIRQAVFEIGHRDGVVFLDGHGTDVEDLAQSVFEACYDAPGYRPGDGELHRLLAGIRLCVVVDDLDVPARELTRLQDTMPSGTVAFSSRERLLWGEGTALALTGLPPSAGLQLLARELGRPLFPAEADTAASLWQASEGNPYALIRAAALARPGPNGAQALLPEPAEVPALLRRAVAGLGDVARQVLALLATAPEAHTTAAVLTLLVPGATAASVEEAVGRLAGLGLLTRTGPHVRLAGDPTGSLPEDLALGPQQLAEAAGRLTAWASAPRTAPASLADHSLLIAGLADALVRDGRPDLGVALTRAAAPGTACSLRWGAWDRILTRGLACARQAGDERARAYFTYETGVRSWLTGKRVAAAAAFGAAAAAWHALGDPTSAAVAEGARALTTPGPAPSAGSDSGTEADAGMDTDAGSDAGVDAGSDAGADIGSGGPGTGTDSGSPEGLTDPSPGTGTGTPHHATPPPSDGSSAPDPSAAGELPPADPPPADPRVPAPGSPPPPAPAPPPGVPVPPVDPVGLSLFAKVLIGGALLAAAAVGTVTVLDVFGGPAQTPPTVPLRVHVATSLFEVKDMPGAPEGPCPANTGKTDCTKVSQVVKGKRGPVEVIPAGSLPPGVSVVYWGCEEGPSSAACTVKADRERTVCATTTSPDDEAARRECLRRTGDQPPATPQSALVYVQLGANDFEVTVTSDAPGTKPCIQPPLALEPSVGRSDDPPPPRACSFVVPLHTKMNLRAEITGTARSLARPFNGEPEWFGCDEGPAAPGPLDPNGRGIDEAGDRQEMYANGTRTCTLTLTTGRYVGLSSTDLSDGGSTAALAGAFAQLPRVHLAPGVTAMPKPQEPPLQRVPCSSAGGPEGIECLGKPSNG
ncbi:ATP-binding protein [Streptomyces sp. NPDC048349]|uniref:ATP-binding protein n=1 Tax=Streptomyces sp. NPDC048349 TaxID=3155486 RepID=UPI0034279B39